MISIVAKSVLKPGMKDEFIAMAQELIAQSRKEEGCIAYSLYEDVQNPEVVTFIEQWRDMRAIAAHNQSPHFTSIGPKLADLRVGAAEVNLYRQL